MAAYTDEVQTEKKYQGNVVILIGSQYYAIREPDSGLSILPPFNRCVQSLILNPTQIDIRRVTTTIANYSFKLVDRLNAITELVAGDAASFMNQEVTIWLGRSGTGMAFSDYFQLPKTRINKIDRSDNSYNFSSTEDTDRIDTPIYDQKSALAGDIEEDTTTWIMRDSIADFPTAGFLKVDDEFVSYTGKSGLNFTGVTRAEMGSTAVQHDINSECVLVQTVTGNPLTILLKILTSGGGGSSYDTLQDGCAISQSLIDITEIETLRDTLFDDVEFSLSLYDLDSALKFIESEILLPNNLRFTYSRNSKLTLAVLDRAVFVDEPDVIDEDTISKFPKWSVDGNKVTNVLDIQWDFDEGTNQYQKRDVLEDAASIATYGRQTPLKFNFKGVTSDLDGATFIADFAERLLARLSVPSPEVQISTHIDKSLQNVGDKTLVDSSQLPSSNGTLSFASELEIISRAINFQTGDVQFKLAFTSFTNIRSCYIAPSDLIQTVISQKSITVPAGRGDAYQAGWVMRLWSIAANDYVSDSPNAIASITADTITFEDDFVTVLTAPNNFRLKFADYDDCVDSQKRYCFVSAAGANFSDGKSTYKVTY